ncbi:RsmE family RNA methyltransferase [Spiroplasma alleghenense]|uniref:Ribosomal RNA small subunit methyltransferase E n=1 Tax=Spiroplasma alleghenense TaxID=216931 RepID=A0A345Z3T2_9MOLU|nr:RsmE family RNA methyltransferase [Spiroplasma alleghenense]AXK51261.1 16S ribosomal RNA methyltransferase RsmE [Spiroplasma alleghenense]
MHRYFVEEKIANSFVFNQENLHHFKNVVKIKSGEQVMMIHNKTEYLVEVIKVTENLIETKIISQNKSKVKQGCRVNLVLGIIREQKWDFVLQKATELGVNKIIPVIFKRNVVKIEDKKVISKLERWKRICEDAAEQSHQVQIPQILPIVTKIEDLKKIDLCKTKLVAYESEKDENFKKYLIENLEEITLVVGPEGGFEKSEISWFEKNDYKIVSLGNRILRAETAPLMFLSNIIFNYEM